MQRRLSADEAQLRPHLRELAGLVDDQARVFEREYARAEAEGVDTSVPKWKMPVGDDLQRLRGLPAVAPGVAGAQPGSDPVRALLAKERRLR